MGLMVDTSVWIAWERSGHAIDFSPWASHGPVVISVITVSELLVGVQRADTALRRQARSSFVGKVMSKFPALDITPAVAFRHAKLFATLLTKGGNCRRSRPAHRCHY